MTQLIPDLSETQLMELAQRIRPVGHNGPDQKLRYYKRIDLDEDITSYRAVMEEAIGLRELKIIETFHYIGKVMGVDQFMPTTEEVLAQIPAEIVDEVVAFEVLDRDFETDGVDDPPDFKDEGIYYHRASILLYGKK